MVRIVVDNRLRMQLSELPDGLAEALRKEFTHSNPAFFKARQRVVSYIKARGGRSVDPKTVTVKGEPEKIVTWIEKGGEISVPRGATNPIRKLFERHGLPEPDWQDRRVSGGRSLGAPNYQHSVQLWEHQEEIVDAALARENCLVRASTGCLSGESVIGINRNGKGFSMPIAELVRMFNGGVSSNRTWNLTQPTMVRARLDDGTIGLVQLVDAYTSGEKLVYQLILESGHSIKATADHRILTSEGWKRLGLVSDGDEVYVEDNRRPTKRGTQRDRSDRSIYRVRRVKGHPFAGRLNIKGGHTVPIHRLVVEANLNGMGLTEFIDLLNSDEIPNLKFINPKTHVVHHVDSNTLNNDLSNLSLLTISQHKQVHAALATMQLRSRTVLSKVVSISDVGKEQTFDLTMAGPNNFVANGIVVHNSGKTTAAIALAVRCGLPTLILVWSSNLFDQWLDRLTAELGLSRGDIGQLRGSKRTLAPITVAMQQTLYANPKFTARIAPLFGCVMADEVQRFAARTFKEAIDVFPARYRIGWSADETRKDKKEFLIYEAFGTVAADIGREKLVKRHLVHDVEIRVVPTDFKADWYRKQQIEDKNPDFNRLLEEMTRDAKRNLSATSIARTMMSLGHQVLMLTHRREHASLFVRGELSNGTRAGLLLGGGENASEFDSTVKAMRAREMNLGAGTYQAIGVGMDIPSVSRGVACTPIATNRQFFGQVCGRLCRTSKGKTDAVLYYLWDKEVFGLEPIMQLKKWNKVVMVEGEGGWIPVEDFIDEWNRSRGKR